MLTIKYEKDMNLTENRIFKNNYTNSKFIKLPAVKTFNSVTDQNNPILQQIIFYSKMLENFLSADSKKSKEEIENEFNVKIPQNQIFSDINLTNATNLKENKEFVSNDFIKELICRKFYESEWNLVKRELMEDIDNRKKEEFLGKKIQMKETSEKNLEKILNKKKEKKKLKKSEKLQKHLMKLSMFIEARNLEAKFHYQEEMRKYIEDEKLQNRIIENNIIRDEIKLFKKQKEIEEMVSNFRGVIRKFKIEDKINFAEDEIEIPIANIPNNTQALDNNLALNEEDGIIKDNKNDNVNINDNINDIEINRSYAENEKMEIDDENSYIDNDINIGEDDNIREVDNIEEDDNIDIDDNVNINEDDNIEEDNDIKEENNSPNYFY